MSAINIRRAAPRDAVQLLELALGLASTQGEPDDVLTLNDVRADMLGRDAAVQVLVAESRKGLCGYISLLPAYEASFVSRGLYVNHLFVAESMRGHGIGRKLMAEAARLAKVTGGSHLWLTMLPSNKAADRFYRRIADIRIELVAHVVGNEAFDSLAAEARGEIAEAETNMAGDGL